MLVRLLRLAIFVIATIFTPTACDDAPSRRAVAAAPDPARTAEEIVAAGPDGETQAVRLAEIRAARAGAAGREARRRIESLLAEAGAGLRLATTGAARDRYGRTVAHAEFDRDGETVWIQAELVRDGLAVVSSYADNRARARDLLALERSAREAGRGGWGEGVFVVRDPDPNGLAQHLDSFQIVEGRVIDAAEARSGRIYLNFGLEWRTDFTVSIRDDDRARFDEAGLDPLSLAGARVRVRGWLYRENGPMIAIDHPEALEVLDAPEAAPPPG
ncbi:thermonuclease family protein [Marinicauda salina]|nr:thermonuclease family protein [Marinicauda salina]